MQSRSKYGTKKPKGDEKAKAKKKWLRVSQQMNTSEALQKKLTLRGRENFIEWMKRFQGLVELEDWCTYSNGSFTEASPKTTYSLSNRIPS